MAGNGSTRPFWEALGAMGFIRNSISALMRALDAFEGTFLFRYRTLPPPEASTAASPLPTAVH
jgi:hypothetical protein